MTKDWTDIHQDFAKKDFHDVTYQQEWEQNGFTHQEAKEWVNAGFTPWDLNIVIEWKKQEFAPELVKEWITTCLGYWEVDLATYLRKESKSNEVKKYFEKPGIERKKLLQGKSKNESAQEYLDRLYPKEQRTEIEYLPLSERNLEGSLDLTDFVNLKELNCIRNKLTSLNLQGLAKLKELNCHSNQLTSLNLTDCSQLTKLRCSNNLLDSWNFLTGWKGNKLEELDLRNNNFIGNLRVFRGINKLKILNISDTNIDSGLEYLPDSVEEFYCSADVKKQAKCKIFEQALSKYKVYGNNYYNISQWKKTTKNILIRNEDIRRNIQKTFGGYSKKEIAKLKDPDQLGNYKYAIQIPQWGGRIASVVGGGLLFVGAGDTNSDYTRTGGVIAIATPFIEAISAYLEKKYYDANENKWDRFIQDSKELWNDYQELREILEPCEYFGEISKGQIWVQEGDNSLIKKTKILYLLWETIKEVYKKEPQQDDFLATIGKALGFLKSDSDNSEENLVTKNQFAQDLQKNWEQRKRDWGEIGEKLMEASKYQVQELADQEKETGFCITDNKELHNALEKNNQSENQSWQNVRPSFAPELIQSWKNHNFTYSQIKDWINIGLQPTDADFCTWLRDTKQKSPEEILNQGNLETLKIEFEQYKQNRRKGYQVIDFQYFKDQEADSSYSTPLCQSLNSSQVNLLNKSQKEEIELQNLGSKLQTQILQLTNSNK